MALLTLYTPNNLKKYSYGTTSTEAKQNKLTALETLEKEGAIIEPNSTLVIDDPTLTLLHSYGDNTLYGNIINYRKRFLK